MRYITTINFILSVITMTILLRSFNLDLKNELLTYLVTFNFIWVLCSLRIIDIIVGRVNNVRQTCLQGFEKLVKRELELRWYHKASLLSIGATHLFVAEYYFWDKDIFYSQLVAYAAFFTALLNFISYRLMNIDEIENT